MICPYCDHVEINQEPVRVMGDRVAFVCESCGRLFETFKTNCTDLNTANDPVNNPSHYVGKIECIDYLRDKLTKEEFTGFCLGNVLKYSSRWRKKDGLQDLKKAKVYLEWVIENEEQE